MSICIWNQIPTSHSERPVHCIGDVVIDRDNDNDEKKRSPNLEIFGCGNILPYTHTLTHTHIYKLFWLA